MEHTRVSSPDVSANPAAARRPQVDWDTAGRIDPAVLSQFLCHQALEIRVRSKSMHPRERPLAMVGQSPAFVAMLDRIAKVARYRESVLITGESGSGKEHVARAISLLETRQGLPFVSVSCPQYQEGNLTVSELFGHVKGSFTGAASDHAGAFAQAHTGTLFLDEIADLPASAQAMLLRTLATGEYKPVGASDGRRVDVRVVAATNRPLNGMMASGAFRHDLFFRLRHFHVPVPPLRERGDDWRLIAEYCLLGLGLRHGVRKRLSPAAERCMAACTWPGNVRQLIAVVGAGYAMADSTSINIDDIAAQLDGYEVPAEGRSATEAAAVSTPPPPRPAPASVTDAGSRGSSGTPCTARSWTATSTARKSGRSSRADSPPRVEVTAISSSISGCPPRTISASWTSFVTRISSPIAAAMVSRGKTNSSSTHWSGSSIGRAPVGDQLRRARQIRKADAGMRLALSPRVTSNRTFTNDHTSQREAKRMSQTMTRGEMQDLVSKFASENPSYRKALVADAKGTIEKQFNISLGSARVKAVTDTADTVHVVVPHVPAEGELSDADLETVAGGGGKEVTCDIRQGGGLVNTYMEVGV